MGNYYLCATMAGVFGHNLKRTFSILLIVVMSALIFNKVVYIHIHVLPDGSMVTHAHPYSKGSDGNPAPRHQHSNLELFLLYQMDVLILSVSAASVLKQTAKSICVPKPVTDHFLSTFVPFLPERAPPICI